MLRSTGYVLWIWWKYAAMWSWRGRLQNVCPPYGCPVQRWMKHSCAHCWYRCHCDRYWIILPPVPNIPILPGFYAYTGCDTTSQFCSKGKKSCWEAWKVYPEVTEAFINMVVQPIRPLEITCTLFELFERFICILYDKTTSVVMVNDLRKELFSRGLLSMKNIPPSQVINKKYLF